MLDNSDIGILARRRIEAEIIKPIYQILKRDFGTERAQALIGEAISQSAAESARQFAARSPQGPDMQSFIALQPLWEQDHALELEVLEADSTRYHYDVKRCQYAEMYQQMGLSEIGHLLSCRRDGEFIAAYAPQIAMTRTTTIMAGDARCNFRYQLRTATADAAVLSESGHD
jgi:hypothetical protein